MGWIYLYGSGSRNRNAGFRKAEKLYVNNNQDNKSDESNQNIVNDFMNQFGTKDNILKDAIMMLFWSAIFSGYILMPIINGDTLPSVLWNTWQVICWVAGGVSKYQDAKDFMVNEYRQTHLVEKTETLGEFLSIMENNESLLDKYDYIGMELKELEEKEVEDNG